MNSPATKETPKLNGNWDLSMQMGKEFRRTTTWLYCGINGQQMEATPSHSGS